MRNWLTPRRSQPSQRVVGARRRRGVALEHRDVVAVAGQQHGGDSPAIPPPTTMSRGHGELPLDAPAFNVWPGILLLGADGCQAGSCSQRHRSSTWASSEARSPRLSITRSAIATRSFAGDLLGDAGPGVPSPCRAARTSRSTASSTGRSTTRTASNSCRRDGEERDVDDHDLVGDPLATSIRLAISARSRPDGRCRSGRPARHRRGRRRGQRRTGRVTGRAG